jgi:broad specificity phosphatase PhoE
MLGHELLDTIHALKPYRTVAAVMRHAARHPIANPAEPTLAEITPEGARAAEAFGARINGFDRIRLFHSPVKRCAQTAQCIARGAASIGVATEIAGPREELGVDYILDLAEAGRLTLLHQHHFVRLWFANQVPGSVIRPPHGIARRKLEFVNAHLRESHPGGRRLDLHVSHDWNVIVLRELLLSIRHEEAGWLTFLDGVAFAGEAAQVRAFYRERDAVVTAQES